MLHEGLCTCKASQWNSCFHNVTCSLAISPVAFDPSGIASPIRTTVARSTSLHNSVCPRLAHVCSIWQVAITVLHDFQRALAEAWACSCRVRIRACCWRSTLKVSGRGCGISCTRSMLQHAHACGATSKGQRDTSLPEAQAHRHAHARVRMVWYGVRRHHWNHCGDASHKGGAYVITPSYGFLRELRLTF